MLAQALGQISDRERYIFFARALEKRSFDDLAAELGIGYKGVAAVYYRAIQKLKKELCVTLLDCIHKFHNLSKRDGNPAMPGFHPFDLAV